MSVILNNQEFSAKPDADICQPASP